MREKKMGRGRMKEEKGKKVGGKKGGEKVIDIRVDSGASCGERPPRCAATLRNNSVRAR